MRAEEMVSVQENFPSLTIIQRSAQTRLQNTSCLLTRRETKREQHRYHEH